MRNYITHEWFTIFTIVGLFSVVIAKYLNTLRFKDFLYVIGNSKYLKLYVKDQKFIDQFDSFLFINLSLSLSTFLFFAYKTFVNTIDFELISFLKLLFAVSTILIIKTLLERLIGSLFEMDSLIDDYLFQKTTFKNFSGIIFLIANLFLLYTDVSMDIVIISAVVIVCLINAIGFLTSFKTHQKLINPNFFYFLLYLCALEIGPYVLLFKVIREYNV
ncbi:DUF4271 domain-containing protein [Winogradskyella sediminis]|uniref:DUF4271 domain-containing protein n=1 Tax=Winogradskyella sediminis TaxID=1382466 RepID=A0A1H1QU55_9FLAO|nr:DUF4271 domain-containing protein [Winogradskyella sediminis]REG89699.1 uncharacterized protein DUF4271 [Winogradskyella sediminis]SDS26960.1 protein of unknown function [Winogradskyella sediminis]